MRHPHQKTVLAATAGLLLGFGLALALPSRPAGASDAPCMFDPSSETYKRCIHASMGRCHHYSTTCEPDCMFDPGSKTYKRCLHPSMGRCHHYSTTCDPDCMFDPDSQTYKGCAHASMGRCHHYTTTCTP